MPSDAFYQALAQRESGGDARIVNTFGFMGLYQMGQPALQDVGYMRSDGTWTGKNGISSQADFLNNPSVQTQAIREYHALVWNNYLPSDVKASVGRGIKDVTITKSGIIAGAHLVGSGGVAKFIRSNGEIDPQDEIQTPCSEYMRKFGIYD